jgi:hypothetical protein
MMRLRLGTLTLVGAMSLLGAQSAHAGMFEWVDNMFTFREDQKARVAPRHLLPPKMVDVPYYDPHASNQWSNYYTRDDLQPETYLTGSASKVMRPADDYGGQNYDTGQNVVIGDPDQGPGMASTGMDGYEATVRKQTKVGAANNDWRKDAIGAAPDNRLGTSRPGDFDYGWRGQRQLGSIADDDGGEKVAGGTVTGPAHGAKMAGDLHDDPRYLKFDAHGKVTQYQVQKGDSLATIAAQPGVYGNSKLWPLIYSANRKAIGKNIHNIKEREKLAIPRNYTKAQATDAIKRSGKLK